MPRQEQILSVFVASPSDVHAERARLEEVVKELNDTWSRTLGVRLDLIRWETHVHPDIGQDPQAVINTQLPNDCDIFIGIMWHRFGTPTGRAESGTQEEFLRAKARWDENRGSVCIMVYFKDAEIVPSQVDATQLVKVADFRRSLTEEGGLCWPFKSTEEFVGLARRHLSLVIQDWRAKFAAGRVLEAPAMPDSLDGKAAGHAKSDENRNPSGRPAKSKGKRKIKRVKTPKETDSASVSADSGLSGTRVSTESGATSQPLPRQRITFRIGDQPVPGYRLVRELGRGTFGTVWLAVNENGFERALKFVSLEQTGGRKEFRALRLVKDRKILHGNLLTLIDYWLLDRGGNVITSPNSVDIDSLGPASIPGSSVGASSTMVADGTTKNSAPLKQGTWITGQDTIGAEKSGHRDTFQPVSSDTQRNEKSQASCLVVATELGHKTLHDRQNEHTAAVARQSATISAQQLTGDNDEELAPLPVDEVLPYMEQAARGLDYLHRCGIVHRDVKPQNIMLMGDVAKVCDFGLASELGSMRESTNAFTLPYSAPEAINNKPTSASDQYSLAVTYVELRTGRWPYLSNTATAVYAAKESGVHYLQFVPNRSVRAVLKRALAKNPGDRYSSCTEFVKQLTKAEAAFLGRFAAWQVALAILVIVTILLVAVAVLARRNTFGDLQANRSGPLVAASVRYGVPYRDLLTTC